MPIAITRKRQRNRPLSRSPSDSTLKTGSRKVFKLFLRFDRYKLTESLPARSVASHCCSTCHSIRHVWDTQRFAESRPARGTQPSAVHCSIERLVGAVCRSVECRLHQSGQSNARREGAGPVRVASARSRAMAHGVQGSRERASRRRGPGHSLGRREARTTHGLGAKQGHV